MEFEIVEGRDIHQPVAGQEGFSQKTSQLDEVDNHRRAMFIPEQRY
ncbi:MAG: hypothetical protein WBA68_12555 [Alteraurantiacibacter sp.]